MTRVSTSQGVEICENRDILIDAFLKSVSVSPWKPDPLEFK